MTLPPVAIAKLDKLVKRVDELTDELSKPEVAVDPKQTKVLAKERGALERTIGPFQEWKDLTKKRDDNVTLLTDPEMAELAKEDLQVIEPRIATLENNILDRLLTDDLPGDPDMAILEIRAGTGGDEAALFAMDLFHMYRRYCEMQGWKLEVLDQSDTELGGLREVTLSVSGTDAFRKLRFESGGHRVQRVPTTETQGRIHTSAATVAVLPEVEDIDIEIKDEDIQVDTMRAGGPGGQKVNKTESAVRLTHIPSGIVVKCQDNKSQHRNRATALRILRSRLFEHRQQELDKKRSDERRTLIGSGDRSERIRTYNFPQSRMTDHRIGLTLYNLPQVMQGYIHEIVDALSAADREDRLKRL